MAWSRLAAAALLAAASFPALGAVTVIGSTSARLCYEAADSPLQPTFQDIRTCDRAFEEDQLTLYDTVATHVNRGILRLRHNRIDEAREDFDRAIELDPEQPEAYLNKGALLIRLNDAQGALPLFSMALEHDTSRPALAHYGRAVANEALGNVREAYFDYRRASELAPEWEEPRTELRRFRVVTR
jgi:tetratricopeptide (TPR) repeat protein